MVKTFTVTSEPKLNNLSKLELVHKRSRVYLSDFKKFL